MIKYITSFFLFLMSGVIIYQNYDTEEQKLESYKKGYDHGYKKAKLIYECEHDQSECEILKEEE